MLLTSGVGVAAAHPLGSFAVNTASALRIGTDRVAVDVVVDFAEVPSTQVRPEVAALGPRSWQDERCASIATSATLKVDGQARPLTATGGSVVFPPGAGGLSTTRLVCRYTADTGTAGADVKTVEYELAAYADRIGWREVVAVGDGTTIVTSDVPAESPSALLSRYPDDPRSRAWDTSRATVTVQPGGPAAPDPLAATADGTGTAASGAAAGPAGPVGPDGPRSPRAGLSGWVSGLVERDSLSLGVGLLALLVAIVLGTAHAVAPGHGKTVMAARIVGGSATKRQLVATAGAVTLTHTLGVLVLAVVLSASSGFAPERVYPWLGVASGILMVGLGATLLRSRLALAPLPTGRRRRRHDQNHNQADDQYQANRQDHELDQGRIHHHGHTHGHSDGADHEHSHDLEHRRHDDQHGHGYQHAPVDAARDRHGHGHGHAHGGRWHVHPVPAESTPLRGLLAAGLVGGMVPTPSAVVVLLGAVAIGRAWFGVLLVIGYGIGMAATLVGVGYLLDRTLMPLFDRARVLVPGFGVGVRWAPVASAAVVVLVGAVVALHAGGQVAV